MRNKDEIQIDIEALTREAYRMRNEMIGEMIRAGCIRLKNLVAELVVKGGAALTGMREHIARQGATRRRSAVAARTGRDRLAH